MPYLKDDKYSPFTKIGFQVFLVKDLPLILGGVIACFILLGVFYYQTLVTVPSPRELAWASNIVGWLHALTSFIVSFLFLTKIISFDSWAILLNITRAFTIYDVIIMLIFPHISNSLRLDILHHIALFIVTLFSYKHARYIAMGFLAELTQVPFYLSWYLLKWDLGHTTLFKVLAALTVLACFVFRVCLFSYITYKLVKGRLYKQYAVTVREIFIFLPITCMNYYWFYLLVKKAVALL